MVKLPTGNCLRPSGFAGDILGATRREIRAGNGDSTLYGFVLYGAGRVPAHGPAMEFDTDFTTDFGQAHRGIDDEAQESHEQDTDENFGLLGHVNCAGGP